jgi:hypothetical protein
MQKQEDGSRNLTAVTGTFQVTIRNVKTGSAEILEESRKLWKAEKIWKPQPEKSEAAWTELSEG